MQKKVSKGFFHSLIGKLSIIIPLIGGGVAIGLLSHFLFKEFPEAKQLISTAWQTVRWFLYIGIFGFFLLSFFYSSTLDSEEFETQRTYTALITAIVFWIMFWFAWSFYLAWLTVQPDPINLSVKTIVIAIGFIPGLIAFLISKSLRKKILVMEIEDELSMGTAYYNSPPSILYSGRKYYTGYYGLLIAPFYVICLIIQFLVRQ